MIESLLILLLYLVVIGAVLWFINLVIDRVPMDPTYKQGAKVLLLIIGLIIMVLLIIRVLPSLPALP